MLDRFTSASAELVENNPYICTTCEVAYGHPTIAHLDDTSDAGSDRDLGTRSVECILNCEPMPFGD